MIFIDKQVLDECLCEYLDCSAGSCCPGLTSNVEKLKYIEPQMVCAKSPKAMEVMKVIAIIAILTLTVIRNW